jgi:hypothetical protein
LIPTTIAARPGRLGARVDREPDDGVERGRVRVDADERDGRGAGMGESGLGARRVERPGGDAVDAEADERLEVSRLLPRRERRVERAELPAAPLRREPLPEGQPGEQVPGREGTGLADHDCPGHGGASL